jgi:hypothetical protein
MNSNLNITKFKKNNREGLFNKLKNFGFAFHKLNYKKDRSIKINKLLNDGLLGWTNSAELKNNTQIDLLLFANKIQIKVNKEIVKEIEDWEEDMVKCFRQISSEYEKYFYTKEEVLEHYKDRADIEDIDRVLSSVYPTLKVRKINDDKPYFSVYLGSSVVTYLVEKKKFEAKKITISTKFLTRNKNMYSGSIWCLPQKYRKILKQYTNHSNYTLNLKNLQGIQEKLKFVH